MSFSTGTADTRENLLDLFRAFAITSGWTVDRYAASGTGYVLNIHKTGKYSDVLYASIRSLDYENLPGSMDQYRAGLVVSMSTSYDSNKDCVDQPGSPARTTSATDYYASSIHSFTAVSKYWFFSDTDPEFLAMVVMLPDNSFRHLTIFECEKLDLTLGQCHGFFATNGMSEDDNTYNLPFQTWSSTNFSTDGTSFLRMNADERNGWWSPARSSDLSGSNTTEGRTLGPGFRDKHLLSNCKNQFSYAAALCPITLYGISLDSDAFPIGYIPNQRIGDNSVFLVDQEYTLGTDVWMGFPARTFSSSSYAIVYRKVA